MAKFFEHPCFVNSNIKYFEEIGLTINARKIKEEDSKFQKELLLNKMEMMFLPFSLSDLK